jgi:integrase/recombinase XerD
MAGKGTFVNWPAPWLEAWRATLVPAGFLDDVGTAANWSLRRRQQAEYDAGRFLRWVAEARPELLKRPSMAAALSPELLLAFVENERGRHVRYNTLATAVANILGVARASSIALPETSWDHCWRVVDRLKSRSRTEQSVARHIAHPQDLYRAGVERMHYALNAADEVIDLDGWQAGLMVALLAAAPIRIKNLASLELDRHLRETPDGYALHLPAEETKTRRPDAWPLPEHLGPYLSHFIEHVRPAMLVRGRAEADHRRLWVGAYGQPLEHQAVRTRIKEVTRSALGRPVLPHSFRHSAATAFVLEHPDRPRDAASLLGHTGYRTTERHYVQSRRVLALRAARQVLEEARRAGLSTTGEIKSPSHG